MSVRATFNFVPPVFVSLVVRHERRVKEPVVLPLCFSVFSLVELVSNRCDFGCAARPAIGDIWKAQRDISIIRTCFVTCF